MIDHDFMNIGTPIKYEYYARVISNPHIICQQHSFRYAPINIQNA